MGMGMNINSIRGLGNRYLSTQQEKSRESFNKLASGLRIAKASDDASGLGISERMRSQIRSLDVASRNTADGISMARTAESGLGEASSTLGRMRELAVRASSGTLSDSDKSTLQAEFDELSDQLDFIGETTEFNGQNLLDGSSGEVDVQTGTDSGDTTAVQFTEVSADSLGLAGLDLSSAAGAGAAIDALDAAQEEVAAASGELGASVNSLNSSRRVLQTSSVQLSASESRIRDVDMAFETAILAKQQILAQGSVALLSHSSLNSTSAKNLF